MTSALREHAALARAATGEDVAVYGVSEIHRGSRGERVPTDAVFETADAWFCRVDDGPIAERWSPLDGLRIMQYGSALPDGASNLSRTDSNDNHSQ